MSDRRAITVVSKRPPLAPRLLVGGIVGAELGLFAAIVGSGTLSAGSLFLATAAPAVFLGGLAALIAFLIQQRRGSFSRLNRDLTGISAMMERGLIDSEEYRRLKTRILDEYQPVQIDAPSILKPALWGALAGAAAPLVFSGAFAPIGLSFAAALILGSLGAAISAGAVEAAYRLGQRQFPELPAGSPGGEPDGWEPLGTRSLPPE